MRIHVVVLGALALLPFLLSPAGAADEVLRIETRYVATADHRPDPENPADRLAGLRSPISVAMESAPPPGTGRVPAGQERFYGAFDAGARRIPFVLAAREGGQGLLALDLDGDGSLGGPGAEVAEVGRSGKVRGRAVTRWTFAAVPLGGARVDVAVHHTAPEHQAVLTRGEPTPVSLAAALPRGARLFDAGTDAAAFGEVEGVALAFVRGRGDRLTVLYDRNRNGVVGESGEVLPLAVAGREEGVTYWQAEGLALPSGATGIAFQEIEGEIEGYVRPSGARRGHVQAGGRTLHLHLLDADLDGRYGTPGDLWWFGPTAHLAQVRKLIPDAMVRADEPVFLDDRAWRLVSVGEDGGAVVMADPGAGTVDRYFHRRADRVNREVWWPQFRAEEAAFREKHGIDPSRPRAAEPVHWLHDVDLEEALARARRESKPVLVDFEADWCSWCKRFDYYVYVDREVAELLRRFVPLKINQEFHFSGDFERLGGQSLPFLVFVRPDGQLLRFTLPDEAGQPQVVSGPPGFQTPAEFAATLRAALAAWGR